MYKKILTIIFIVTLFILTPEQINEPKRIIKKITPEIANININKDEQVSQKEQPIGKVQIPKINLNKNLYKIGSKLNNVEENVTILESDLPSIIVLAAHSGTGKNAFFKDLNKLNINDTINLTYTNANYTYTVINIFEQDKSGYITINEKEYDKDLLGELTVYDEVCKQPNRKGCALIPYKAIEKSLEGLNNENQ